MFKSVLNLKKMYEGLKITRKIFLPSSWEVQPQGILWDTYCGSNQEARNVFGE